MKPTAKTLLSVAILMASGCVYDEYCPDGVYDRSVSLVEGGYYFYAYPSLLSAGWEKVVPYEEMPFQNCRVIGDMSVGENAVLDSEHYPLLEELGTLTIAAPAPGQGDYAIGDLTGFDNVVRFGGIDDSEAAPVRNISGFNAVEVIDGPLRTTGTISGFSSLQAVEGTLYAVSFPRELRRIGGTLATRSGTNLIDLPYLEFVGEDLYLWTTAVQEVGFPSLTRIGGDLVFQTNTQLETLNGFGPGLVVGGDFLAASNRPIGDDAFLELVFGDMQVEGEITVLGNGPIPE
jgi:hypothetical protein